jgi:hypothetical protein
MDWSVFIPALAANLTGQISPAAAALYLHLLLRRMQRRWQEAQQDEANT